MIGSLIILKTILTFIITIAIGLFIRGAVVYCGDDRATLLERRIRLVFSVAGYLLATLTWLMALAIIWICVY